MNNFNDLNYLNKNKKSLFNFSFLFSANLLDLLFLIFIIFLLFFSGKKLYYYAIKSDYFSVKDIRIDNLYYIPKDYFYLLISDYFKNKYISNKPNLLLLDLNDLKKYIFSKSDRFLQIDISKVYPSILHFKVIERKPIGCIKIYNDIKLIDCSGIIFDKVNNEFIDLPIISNIEKLIYNNVLDEKLSYILLFLDFLSNKNDFSVSEIYYISDNEIIIYVNYYQLFVKLNKFNLIIKFNLFKDIIDKVDYTKINYIDLRFNEPVISFK
ncbi:MAG TPA: cell division protein FtsQ/DivIB [bacterium]|nr:cell division protein FtsQ/DivIB [bacterium]HOL46577.1 cell division protein FtsQ/DivIB [bacterium]HPQ17852.1 cell division protein FtsQ/DivIB [bacterium]